MRAPASTAPASRRRPTALALVLGVVLGALAISRGTNGTGAGARTRRGDGDRGFVPTTARTAPRTGRRDGGTRGVGRDVDARAHAFAGGRKAHALVTGGAGFIGSHCVKALLARGYAVTSMDNLSRGNGGAIAALKRTADEGSFRVVEGDLGRVEDIERAFTGSNLGVDVVFHFAAIAYVGESMADPLRYYRNITVNTVNLLRVMDAYGVNNMIYSSTCATYGNVEKLPITESTPTKPINPYGKSKLYAENVIKDYALTNPKFKTAILRYFNVFGSDPDGVLGELPRAELREHGRISGACFDAAMGKVDKLTVMGTKHPTRDGTTIRDFVHVIDLVDAHIAVAEKNKWDNPPSLYNVGTGSGVSMREFVDACKNVTGKQIEVYYREEPRPGDYAEVYANVDKIKHELGWSAKYTDLSESLAHAWKFRQKFSGDTWD